MVSPGFTAFLPWWILLLPLIGAAVNGLGAFRWPERRWVPTLVGPAAVVLAFAVVCVNFFRLLGASPEAQALVHGWTWISVGKLQLGADLRFDRLSMFMLLVVTGVSSVIHVYSIGYMREDPGYSRFFAYLNLFVFFMLVLVLGANYPMLFVGWEGVGLCSYLLIGFWYQNRDFSNAGKKAFIVNRIGDFGFLIAMFLLFQYLHTLDIGSIAAQAPGTFAYGGGLITVVTLLLFLACVGKSAQIPLYVWLPDAMAGPTPVSALIHAATMVTAGVYLVARSSVLFVMAPVSQSVVAAVGAGTALFAATIAVQQYDIKKVLAYSTISQLGYMFLAVGVGAFTAGMFHLMTHAFFKALLFLGAGSVIHSVEHVFHDSGEHGDANDMRNHGGLRRTMPVTWLTMWAATLAISGVFPFAGFFSKDEIIWSAGVYGYPVLWAVALVAAFLTAGYMARLMFMTFHGENRTPGAEDAGPPHESPAVMWVPLAILGVLSLVGGWIQIPDALPGLPGVHALESWLEPAFAPARQILAAHVSLAETAPAGGGEAVWGLVSFLAAVIVIVLTGRAVLRRRYLPAADSPEPTGFARVLYKKWYVDELYERLVVGPLLALWRGCWKIVDAGIIDGTVNGVAGTARTVGRLGSLFQTGQVGTYVFVFVLGVLVILGTLAF